VIALTFSRVGLEMVSVVVSAFVLLVKPRLMLADSSMNKANERERECVCSGIYLTLGSFEADGSASSTFGAGRRVIDSESRHDD
jgi:hypothetical protein